MSVIGLTVFWGSQMAIFNPVAGSLGGDEKRISGINHRVGGGSGIDARFMVISSPLHKHTDTYNGK